MLHKTNEIALGGGSMPKPKGSTPAGDKSLQQGGGHREMRAEKQLPRIVDRQKQAIKYFLRKIRGERQRKVRDERQRKLRGER